jgi:hypothetical protein
MGVFRKRWEYTRKRKIPTAPTAVPGDVSTTLVSRVHPSKNISLRDHTFRILLWQYYVLKRVIPPAVFVPGMLNAIPRVFPSVNPRLRDSTFRPPHYHRLRHVLPPSVFVPEVGNVLSRRAVDTFKPSRLDHYQPSRTLPPSIFVPGITNAPPIIHPSRNPRLRDTTFRPPFLDYYQPKRVLYPSQFVPGMLNAVPITHPSRNPRLRDNAFRPPWLEHYQPKRVLPPAVFVPGILPLKRIRHSWKRDKSYWHRKRAIPTSAIALVPSVPLARNFRSRDEKPVWLRQPKRTLPPSVFIPGSLLKRLKSKWGRLTDFRFYQRKRVLPSSITIAPAVNVPLISKVYPSRNVRLRDDTFRHVDFESYVLKRVISTAVFVPAILIAISKIYPSRNIRLRDDTFRPPTDYYQPDRPFLNVPEVVPPEPPEPPTARGSRWHQKTQRQMARDQKGRPFPKWFKFLDEIIEEDDELIIFDDD